MGQKVWNIKKGSFLYVQQDWVARENGRIISRLANFLSILQKVYKEKVKLHLSRPRKISDPDELLKGITNFFFLKKKFSL